MKEMYKDNAGNWHYGCKGEKLTEVSYSTNSVPNSIPIEWIKAYVNRGSDFFLYAEEEPAVIKEMLEEWEKENDRNQT